MKFGGWVEFGILLFRFVGFFDQTIFSPFLGCKTARSPIDARHVPGISLKIDADRSKKCFKPYK